MAEEAAVAGLIAPLLALSSPTQSLLQTELNPVPAADRAQPSPCCRHLSIQPPHVLPGHGAPQARPPSPIPPLRERLRGLDHQPISLASLRIRHTMASPSLLLQALAARGNTQANQLAKSLRVNLQHSLLKSLNKQLVKHLGLSAVLPLDAKTQSMFTAARGVALPFLLEETFGHPSVSFMA
jgi:hypothetical protein